VGTKDFSQLITEVGRLGRWDVSDTSSVSYGHARFASEEGLHRIARLGAHVWLRGAATLTLAADDYTYTTEADMHRVRKTSFRYGGKGSYLTWRDMVDEIDQELGPEWRDSGTDPGTPRLVTRQGNEIWIAPKPTLAFVTANPTLYYYYLKNETVSPVTTTLLLPDAYFNAAIHASLAEGLKQKDDKLQNYYEVLFQRTDMPEILGFSHAIGGGQRLRGGGLADNVYFHEDQGYY